MTAQLERLIDTAVTREWQVPLGSFDVLAALARLGAHVQPSDVADELRMVRSTLTRRIDRLEEEGWISRGARPDLTYDHCATVIVLTPRGRALWRAMNVTYRRAVQAHVMYQLCDDDVATLRQLSAVVAPERSASTS